jgi:hypothetical protein
MLDTLDGVGGLCGSCFTGVGVFLSDFSYFATKRCFTKSSHACRALESTFSGCGGRFSQFSLTGASNSPTPKPGPNRGENWDLFFSVIPEARTIILRSE